MKKALPALPARPPDPSTKEGLDLLLKTVEIKELRSADQMSDEELDIECFEDCEEEDEIVPESDDIFDKLEPPAKKSGRRKKRLAKKKKKAAEENEDREEDELKPAAKEDGAQTS